MRAMITIGHLLSHLLPCHVPSLVPNILLGLGVAIQLNSVIGVYISTFQLNRNDACYYVSDDVVANYTIPATRRLVDIFRTNFPASRDPKWQYVGTEDGVTVVHPASDDATCAVTAVAGKYDPRFR